jgi:hypothetical protein
MTTDNDPYRAKLLAAAQLIQAKRHAWEAGLRAFVCSHLGLAPGTVCDQAEAIISANNPRELSDAQLNLVVHFAAGIPPGFQLSEEQIDIALEALLGQPS